MSPGSPMLAETVRRCARHRPFRCWTWRRSRSARADSRVRAGPGDGGRARGPLPECHLRGPGHRAVRRSLRRARAPGPALPGPPGHRVHGVRRVRSWRRGRDRAPLGRWRDAARHAAHPALRGHRTNWPTSIPNCSAYLQLCDAPLAAPPDAVAEARIGRLLPGAGKLPLGDLLAAVPGTVPVAVEAPHPAGRIDPVAFATRARRALESVLRKEQS